MKILAAMIASALALGAADLRIGIVGTDTSHVPAFTSVLNDPNNKDHITGARVVAAFKGGSPDLKESSGRVDKFAEEIRAKYGVEIVPDIATLMAKVDAVLLESVDGRAHLPQFREIVKAGKPVFIDKPLASTLEDARSIAQLAKERNVKWFTSSSLRFSTDLPALRIPGLNGAVVWGPGPVEEHHQLDMTWYGIHAVEILYALLGTGCEEVTRTVSADADVVTGRWKDGRLGTVRLQRPYSDFGATVFAPKQIKSSEKNFNSGYAPLVREIMQFFQNGKPPVDPGETLEMFAFMDAAQRSKAAGGAPMKLR